MDKLDKIRRLAWICIGAMFVGMALDWPVVYLSAASAGVALCWYGIFKV